MKHFFRSLLGAAALVGLLVLPGCGPDTKNFDLLSIVTTTITNPVDATDIYRAKNAYAIALEAEKAYLGYCWSQPYPKLMKDPVAKTVCERRRPMARAMHEAKAKASSAIVSATTFVRDNPTINATDVISEMWAAVRDFQNATPAVPK